MFFHVSIVGAYGLLCNKAAVAKPIATTSLTSESENESDGCEIVEAVPKGGRRGKTPVAKAKAAPQPAKVGA